MALFLVPGLAAAGPTLSGRFQAQPFGLLELKTEGDHVVGVPVGKNACDFPAEQKVLEGDFEGSVLVARLTLCLEGETCPREQGYSVLGIYSETDRVLVAHVRIPEGCSSKALPSSKRFILEPVRGEVPAATPTIVGTAAELASKRVPRNPEAAKQAFDAGTRAYQTKDYKDAVRLFDISLYHEPGERNWQAWLGRAASNLKQGSADTAIRDLERARAGNGEGSKDGRALYLLGCAYAQKGRKGGALGFMKRAVDAGYRLHEAVESEPDLAQGLANDPQFQELLKKSREKKPQARGMAGTGNSIP